MKRFTFVLWFLLICVFCSGFTAVNKETRPLEGYTATYTGDALPELQGQRFVIGATEEDPEPEELIRGLMKALYEKNTGKTVDSIPSTDFVWAEYYG